jgi:hypothetical protein
MNQPARIQEAPERAREDTEDIEPKKLLRFAIKWWKPIAFAITIAGGAHEAYTKIGENDRQVRQLSAEMEIVKLNTRLLCMHFKLPCDDPPRAHALLRRSEEE